MSVIEIKDIHDFIHESELEPHEATIFCWCDPQPEYQGGGVYRYQHKTRAYFEMAPYRTMLGISGGSPCSYRSWRAKYIEDGLDVHMSLMLDSVPWPHERDDIWEWITKKCGRCIKAGRCVN